MYKIYKNSKILLLGSILMSMAGLTSCIKNDNYAAPGETIQGTIYDSLTGKPFQADQNLIRIELLELSWTEATPTPNYFSTNFNGYYHNSKIFKGFYNINVNGPFVPLDHKLWPAPNKNTENLSVKRQIEGVVTQDFTVSAILEVDWAEEPVYNAADSTISATVIITRGTNNPLFSKNPVTDINFLISLVPYPNNGNHDVRYSVMHNSGKLRDNKFVLGKPYKIKSLDKGKIARRTWVRVASRTSVSLPTGQVFNYSTIKEVTAK